MTGNALGAKARILQFIFCLQGYPGLPELPVRAITTSSSRRTTMAWTKPEFIDWRFGFEITLYIANR